MSTSSTLDVVAAIFLKNSQVLAFRRAPHKPQGGLWEFPGGKVEIGEDPAGALSREIREELGFECSILRVFDVSATFVGVRTIRLQTFLCLAPATESFQSRDHDDFKLVSSSEAFKLDWAQPDLPALKRLKNEGLIN